MVEFSFPTIVAWTIAAIFAASGLLHMAGPRFIREAYERWNFPVKFYRVTGAVELLAAIFLSNPITRIWGVVLAGLITFVAIITLLNNRQYAYTAPGILLLIALVPATLAAAF